MAGGLARVAYQDREATALKYAYETKRGAWTSYVLDPGTGEDVGQHTSITIDGAGRPAIAYLAVGYDDGMGNRITELRLARAGVLAPKSASDWMLRTIARGQGSCGGLCGSGDACVAGVTETCRPVTTDCTGACADDQACVAGACTDVVEAPDTAQLATGTGLFVNLVVLADGRLAAVYYDRNNRALVIAVETGVDTNEFTESTLDAVTPGDRGMWASAVVDGGGTVHIAYQDAIGDQLMYTTWNGTATAPEVVDDGQRPGDRPHPVGAAASIYLVDGGPVIAYQDGLTADVYVAAKGSTWTVTPLATGPLLDGISIAATTGHGVPYLAWSSLDPATTPINSLVVQTP